jgi:malate synthase
MSGSLFDFGLYFFHNAKELLARGSGPYFYLPKLESRIEARLWNDVFVRAQQLLGVPHGSIRATVLVESILATFEMDEILYELRNHSAGLNCGRWDYIFSFIKKFSASQNLLFPDRSQVTMTTPFMRSYAKLTIKTCHHRNAPAIGGMSAFIPIKSDPVANDTAITQVRADKEREATDGHDGTWVAHPGLVPIAKEVFDRVMPQPNQISKQLPDYSATAAELLAAPTGTITYNGLKHNIAVGLGYLEAWMRGTGCVPLFNLMEDAATAEISRAQLWQWVHHHAVLQDDAHAGQPITAELCDHLIDAEVARALVSAPPARVAAYNLAATLIRNLIDAPKFQEFLTLSAYNTILKEEGYNA